MTASAWDIPPAWSAQLAGGGRIVVPLRMRGLTRSVVFEAKQDHLASRGYELCSFVPVRGLGAPGERLVALDGEDVGLRVDEELPVEADRLREALSRPRVEAWPGVTITEGERFDGLGLWLAVNLPMFGVLTARQDAVDRGVVAHAWPLGMAAAIEGGSFAYLGLRPVTPDRRLCEFGVYGHGPDAGELVGRVAGHVRSWDRSSLAAHIGVYPAGMPDSRFPAGALLLDRKHSRVVVSWP